MLKKATGKGKRPTWTLEGSKGWLVDLDKDPQIGFHSKIASKEKRKAKK